MRVLADVCLVPVGLCGGVRWRPGRRVSAFRSVVCCPRVFSYLLSFLPYSCARIVMLRALWPLTPLPLAAAGAPPRPAIFRRCRRWLASSLTKLLAVCPFL